MSQEFVVSQFYIILSKLISQKKVLVYILIKFKLSCDSICGICIFIICFISKRVMLLYEA